MDEPAGAPEARLARGGDPVAKPPVVQRGRVFAIVALALLMMSVDSTIVATALHALQQGLDTSINWAGWTITAYSLGFVLMLPLSGRLSERFGRRRVFLASVVAFTGASLLCALADDIYVLIALRALQAAGGAGFTPSATGIVVDYFGDQRDRAVSLFGSIFPIGAMIGPFFGGLFVAHWSWRGVFFVNVPIGIAIVFFALRWIPRDAPLARRMSIATDGAGMALLGSGLLAGMLAASWLGEPESPVGALGVAAAAAVALAALWAFFRHIASSAEPFIAPRLIHGTGFGAVNLVNASFGGLTNGAMVLLPLYAINRYAIDALGAGTLLVVQGAAAIALSFSAAMLLRRTGHRLPLYVGGGAIAFGLLLLAIAPVGGATPFGWLAAASFVIGAGRGTINPASRNAGLQLAPEHSSTLAALRTASLQVGSITTVSVVTAILARFGDPGLAQAFVYAALAVLLAAAMALIARVPEHRGTW